MQIRRIAAVAALGVLAAGVYAPATAAPKKKPKPITKSYAMQLMPVPDPVMGTPSCARPELEDVSIHTEVIKPTGPGILTVKANGFAGDWDITLFDKDHEELGVGDGTTTPSATTAGEDTLVLKFKKAQELHIAICNFAGGPSAKGEYTYKYL